MTDFSISNLLPDILTLCAGVIGFAWKWGRIENRIDQLEDDQTEIKTIDKRLDELNVTLQKICTALWGIDGQNGLRGELRETKDDVKNLLTHLIQFKDE